MCDIGDLPHTLSTVAAASWGEGEAGELLLAADVWAFDTKSAAGEAGFSLAEDISL